MNQKFQEYFINHWVGLADMWAYSHQPRIATFNNRTNNRLEAANRQLKRKLCRRDCLAVCINKVWDHVNRCLLDHQTQLSYDRSRRVVYPSSESLGILLDRLTPPMARLCWNNWSKASCISVLHEEQCSIRCFDNGKIYHIDKQSVSCSCFFNVDFALPCRHMIRLLSSTHVDIGKSLTHYNCLLDFLQNSERWTRAYNLLPDVPRDCRLTDQPANNMEQYDSYVRKVGKVISRFIHSCPLESLPAFCADIEMCVAEQLKKYTDLSMPPVKVLPNSSHTVHFKSRFRYLDECCQVCGTDEPLPWFICQRCGSSHAECIPSTSTSTTCPKCHGPLDSSDMQY